MKTLHLEIPIEMRRAELNFFHSGKYREGYDFVSQILAGVEARRFQDERTNTRVGSLQLLKGVILTTESGPDADFEESIRLFQHWTPMNAEHPSRMERHVVGRRMQYLGKVLKDKGHWSDAARELGTFLSQYAANGSMTEGCAAGDLAQVLIEIGSLDEAENALCPQLERRIAGLSQKERAQVRKNDTMFLEIQMAECRVLQGRYREAEDLLLELKTRFASFKNLWHFEKGCALFVLIALARIPHLQRQWTSAVARWEEAIDYAQAEIDVGAQRGRWGRDSYFVALAVLSLADALYELGAQGDAQALEKARSLESGAEGALARCVRMLWMLGLGTYWPDFVGKKMAQRRAMDG
ncbi:MAG: hypothetical protein M1828_003068 [Chrysothrix sp. TS-e1954]|nr:MAG: hypothetical protein M1828_003068 [Chrysothrix sp. TS-e1954]